VEKAHGHEKIIAYWSKRKTGLSRQEWADFYQLLFPLLMRTQLPDEYASQDRRRELVSDFIADKIILNAETSAAGPLESVYALHSYLKRYAIDRLRQQLPESEIDDEPGAGCAIGLSIDQTQLLAEAGIDIEHAINTADSFLAGLESAERAYLTQSTCADTHAAEPVSAVASRLQLGSSYHYKAKQLGITGSKGGFFHGYENTKIGRWLTAAGARICDEWKDELLILITILCIQAYARERLA